MGAKTNFPNSVFIFLFIFKDVTLKYSKVYIFFLI